MHQSADALRAFNRFYTRQIGLLDRSYLDSGMSLSQGRILYEIHDGKRSARQIAQHLSLDEGYLSRVLAGFIKKGLIERHPSKADRRRGDLTLTKAGERLMADLIERSRKGATERLSTLNAIERKKLFEAMDTIQQCLSPETSPPQDVQLRDIQIGDLGHLASRHGVLYAQECGFDQSFELLVADILLDYWRDHDPKKERAWIAAQGDQVLGSIFCVRIDEATAKLRLFHLEPEVRGLGLGRRMLETCINFAREAGYQRLALWTHESHQAACALYQKTGFTMLSQTPVRSFGQDLVEQAWQIDL